MAKMRLHEACKQYNMKQPDMVTLLEKLGFSVKPHAFSAISDEMIAAIDGHLSGKGKAKPAAPVTAGPTVPPVRPVAPPPATTAPVHTPGQHAPRPAQPPQVARPGQPGHPTPGATMQGAPGQGQPRPDGQFRPPLPTLIVKKDDKRDDKKRGPKPLKDHDEEEAIAEVSKQITIIKTTPVKREAPPKKVKKKPEKKPIMKGRGPIGRHSLIQPGTDEPDIDETPEVIPLDQLPEVLQTEARLPILRLPQEVTVNELAEYLDAPASEVIKKLMGMSVFASLNQRLEQAQVELLAREFGREAVFTEDVISLDEEPDTADDLKTRPPVVTIMGHVDHGKTSLLDRIRKARVAEGEYGGITQHIGAYTVNTKQGSITFLDTPGHEAFTAMRAQGAQITDLAILVVAADDGVQPQTVEAIHHAQAAGVPIIVAINKIDKPDANPDKVKQQLMPYNLVAEDWGGKTIFCNVSARTGDNIEALLEMILLSAEMLELKANPSRAARGVVIEARLDRGMGPLVTGLVQNGTLRVGDHIICGVCYGKVKALITDTGARIKEAGPAEPVQVLGLNEVPKVGDRLLVVESAKFARYVGTLRQKSEREERLGRDSRIKLVDLFKKMSEGEVKDLNIIIKADVQGSSGALKDSLEKLSNSEIRINVLHSGVGAITESDVMLAKASNAIILGFHVRPAHGIENIAAREGVEIKIFRIIYDAIDAVKAAMHGMYEPEFEEEILGKAEVRQVFRIPKAGSIAGCFVIDGRIVRDASVRVIRDGIEIYEGKVSSLKRFKDDVREVVSGYECGIGVTNFNDIKEKDVIEAFHLKKVIRALEGEAKA